MTNEAPALVEHIGNVEDGKVSCSCDWPGEENVSPGDATAVYIGHLNLAFLDPDTQDEAWATALRVGHMFLIGAHERAYGTPLGVLKTQPSKGRIRTMLSNLKRDGELISQQPPYTEDAPVAPAHVSRPSSESEPNEEEED